MAEPLFNQGPAMRLDKFLWFARIVKTATLVGELAAVGSAIQEPALAT